MTAAKDVIALLADRKVIIGLESEVKELKARVAELEATTTSTAPNFSVPLVDEASMTAGPAKDGIPPFLQT